MSEKGEPRQRRPEQDDWWAQLYATDAPDTGRSSTEDTLDDRFASVTRTMRGSPARQRGGPSHEESRTTEAGTADGEGAPLPNPDPRAPLAAPPGAGARRGSTGESPGPPADSGMPGPAAPQPGPTPRTPPGATASFPDTAPPPSPVRHGARTSAEAGFAAGPRASEDGGTGTAPPVGSRGGAGVDADEEVRPAQAGETALDTDEEPSGPGEAARGGAATAGGAPASGAGDEGASSAPSPGVEAAGADSPVGSERAGAGADGPSPAPSPAGESAGSGAVEEVRSVPPVGPVRTGAEADGPSPVRPPGVEGAGPGAAGEPWPVPPVDSEWTDVGVDGPSPASSPGVERAGPGTAEEPSPVPPVDSARTDAEAPNRGTPERSAPPRAEGGAAARKVSDAVGVPAGGEVSASEEAVAEESVGAREEAEFPVADPSALADLLPGTVLDGGRHGACTVRAVSRRGPAAEARGLPRGEALLTVRFGTGAGALLLVAVAAGPVGIPGAHRAAREACHSIARSVGRSHVRLGEDIRAGRRGALKSGLSRLADRSYGKLRAQAAALGLAPDTYTAELRCLLVPEDPACALRVFFGVGEGGLFRLREGEWQDLEPPAPREAEDAEDKNPDSRLPAAGPRYGRTSDDDDPRHALGRAWEAPSADATASVSDADTLPGDAPLPAADRGAPDPARAAAAVGGVQAEAPHTRSKPYRFRATEARRGDVLLLCSTGIARLLRDDRPLAAHLRSAWKPGAPAPPLPRFFADLDVEELPGRTAAFDETYPEDRTAAAVWESP